MTDQNATTHTYSRDGLGRLTTDAVTTLGGGVDGSVRKMAGRHRLRGGAGCLWVHLAGAAAKLPGRWAGRGRFCWNEANRCRSTRLPFPQGR